MKIARVYVFGLLVLSILLAACKHEDSTFSFPQTLYYKKIAQKTDVRLFVNKTEIKNAAIKAAFTANSDIFKGQIPLIPSSLTFVTESETSFAPAAKYYGNSNGNQLLFYSDQSILIMQNDLVNVLVKYRYPNTAAPPSSGFDYFTKEARVGYGSYAGLDLSLFVYKLVRSTYSSGTLTSYHSQEGAFLNEFDESFIQNLGPTDTLAIQSFSLKMARE